MGRSMGRAVGRTRELDPAHRRDGLGRGAAGAGRDQRGRHLVRHRRPGRALADHRRSATWSGWVRCVLPVLLALAGVVLMVATPRPDSRPRIAVGSLLLALGVLGLVHLAAGRPDEPARWAEGGGALGYLAATPLATGLTAWVAAPVLVLLSGYAFLVLTATPVRQVPNRIRRLLGRAVEERRRAGRPETAAGGPPDPVTDAEPAPLRRPSRRRQASRVADVYRDGEPEDAGADADPGGGRRTPAPARPGRPAAAAVPATPPAEPVPDPGPSTGEQLRLTVRADRGRGALPAAAQRPAAHRPGAQDPQRRQRRDDRVDHRGARPVLGGRAGHRLHPGPDGDPLRDRAGPGGQGREDHPADQEHLLRGGHRQRAHPGPDPGQVGGGHRGAQHRPRDGAPGRRAAQRHRPFASSTRWSSGWARTSRATSCAPTWPRCRTCWWPARPAPASPASSTRCWSRCCPGPPRTRSG